MTITTEHASATVTHLQLLIEQEKTAMAREIHDDLGGLLIATSMDLVTLKQRLNGSDPIALQKIDRASASLNAAIDMMRRMTEELHPTLLDNVGLFAALQWQMKQICHRSSILCTDSFPDGELRLRPATAISLFRVGQEALLVAENQVDACHIDFNVSVENETFVMRVRVDGSDAPPAAGSRGDVALGFLRHRLEAMEGSVAVDQPPVGGLRIVATVHLDTMSTSETQAVRILETQASLSAGKVITRGS